MAKAQHVKPARANWVIVTISEYLHEHLNPKKSPRICGVCGSAWTVRWNASGTPDVWKNNTPMNSAILDWVGNNVAVECCAASTLPGSQDEE